MCESQSGNLAAFAHCRHPLVQCDGCQKNGHVPSRDLSRLARLHPTRWCVWHKLHVTETIGWFQISTRCWGHLAHDYRSCNMANRVKFRLDPMPTHAEWQQIRFHPHLFAKSYTPRWRGYCLIVDDPGAYLTGPRYQYVTNTGEVGVMPELQEAIPSSVSECQYSLDMRKLTSSFATQLVTTWCVRRSRLRRRASQ